MIRLVTLLVACGALVLLALPLRAADLIPAPAKLERHSGKLYLPTPLGIEVSAPELAAEAALLRDYLAAMGRDTDKQTAGPPDIRLDIDASLQPSRYRLTVDGTGLRLAGGDRAAVFYGIQSLRQLLFAAPETVEGLVLEKMRIEDQPRFTYRGMHLDVSRHFFDVEFIKRYLDLMALHRMNYFHWHLTDDQGWRLQSKAFPRLTEVGAWREGTVVGHTHDAGAVSDGERYGGYYSWDDVREVVDYAAARHITVVPEIDVPGHASAMLAAYPELGCTGKAPKVQTHFGIFTEVLCPTETTFEFLEVLLAEVAALFPGPYIHVGGDEVRPDQWQDCRECAEIMAREGLADFAQLRGWFVNRTEEIVNGLGKRIIGWDEILDGDVRPSATVMSWRGTEGGITAAGAGHDVIMTPLQHVYFDFYQSHSLDEPPAIHGLTRLQDVYRFNPVPAELLPAERVRILGAQGNPWTESVPDEATAERMILPRMSALAEVLWTPQAQRNFEDFVRRLPAFEAFLLAAGYAPADAHYKPHIAASENADGSFTVTIDSVSNDIRYTLDGAAPDPRSRAYAGPFIVSGDVTVRARSVLPDGLLLGDARLSLVDHLGRSATAHRGAALDDGPKDFGQVLVDGRIGSDRIFSYPVWQSFGDEQGADVVFTWPEPQRISALSIGIEPGQHRRMYRPTSLLLQADNADGDWRDIARLHRDEIDTDGKRIELAFPPTTARRLRLVMGNDQRVWSEEQGHEIAPPLRMDEVIIR